MERSAALSAETMLEMQRRMLRIASLNMQVSFSPALESQIYPTTEKIVAAIEAVCAVDQPSRRFVA